MLQLSGSVLLAAASFLCLSTPSWAQVISQLPNPHAATCDDFKHQKSSGTWWPKGEVQVTSTGGTVSLSPGDAIRSGVPIEGYDLGKWLDANCHKARSW
jgi:hypothetical protein